MVRVRDEPRCCSAGDLRRLRGGTRSQSGKRACRTAGVGNYPLAPEVPVIRQIWIGDSSARRKSVSVVRKDAAMVSAMAR